MIDHGSTTRETMIEAAAWAEACRAGWVEQSQSRWRLSKAGRSHLRRALSTSSVAPIRGTATPSRADACEKPRLNDAESPLFWLSRRKHKDGTPLISQTQLDAGERLRSDFTRAHMTPRVTASWSPTGGITSGRRSAPGTGVELQDGVVAAQERVRRALSAVGPDLAGILLDVCCHLKGLETVERDTGLPPRSASRILLIALNSLARHYGLDRNGPAIDAGHDRYGAGTASRAPAIRHWGSEDFRPIISSDEGEPGSPSTGEDGSSRA